MSKWEIGHPPTGAVQSGSGGGGRGGELAILPVLRCQYLAVEIGILVSREKMHKR